MKFITDVSAIVLLLVAACWVSGIYEAGPDALPPLPVIALGIYLIPTLVAGACNTTAVPLIFVFNLLLGWTGIGWLLSLVWAFAGEKG